MNDPAAVAIAQALAARGAPWPGPIVHFATIESTNRWLLKAARAGAADRTAAVADSQTQGRGRQGRAWHSPHGGLYLSVLFHWHDRPERAGLVGLLGGLAVAEVLSEWGIPAAVKWPNDVQLGGKKIAGVLAEGVVTSGVLRSVVLGVGFNLDLGDRESPPLPDLDATCVRWEGVEPPDRASAAAAVLQRTAVWYDALAAGQGSRLVREWRSRSLPWWGQRVEARTGGRVVSGLAVDVNEDGHLVVESGDGSRAQLVSGDVTQVRLAEGSCG
jgi:BirA family biotin operon repressor/biotin-[acetyl-CoA-carboxylase] ligase